MKNRLAKFHGIFGRFSPVAAMLLLILFLTAVPGSGKDLELKSTWRDRTIAIDGANEDWTGKLQTLEKEDYSFGVMNDQDYLYFCLVTGDPNRQEQMMLQGFVLWFDAKGGHSTSFGIECPISIYDLPIQFPSGLESLQRQEQQQQEKKPRPLFQSIPRERLEETLRKLKVDGPGKDIWEIFPIDKVKGIEAAVKITNGTLVYELKIPLRRDDQNPNGINTKTGSLLGLGMQVPTLSSSGMGSGGYRGERFGGGIMGMRGGKDEKWPKEISVWAKVQLAAGPGLP